MRLLLPIFSLVVLAGCEAPIESQDSAILESRGLMWEQAFADRNIDDLVDLYSPTARVMAPNKEMTAGIDAVRSELGGMIGAGFVGDFTTIEARHAGDIGYRVGVYTLADPNGSVIDRGKFLETWRLGRDGHWRITNDIFNSDSPADHSDGHSEPAQHTTVTLIHEVDDPDLWLAAWRDGNRKQLFKDNGAVHVHAFQDAASENMTGLVVAVADMSRFNAFLESDEVQRAATEDGVRMDTLRRFDEIL